MIKLFTILLINTTVLLACNYNNSDYLPSQAQNKPADPIISNTDNPKSDNVTVPGDDLNNKLASELDAWARENPAPIKSSSVEPTPVPTPTVSKPPQTEEIPKDKRYALEKGTVVPGCEAFQLESKGDKAILLLHGLGGCPYEVRSIGEYLNKEGYYIDAVRYPGHGTTDKDLSTYSWKDWFGVAETEYQKLKEKYKTVYVTGFSTGGTLTLYLDEKYPLEKFVLLSPFIYVSYKWYYGFRPETYLNSPVGKLFDYIPRKLTPLNLNDPEAKKKYIAGDYFSFGATRSALDLITNVKQDIKKVKSPALIIQSKNDDTSDYKSSVYIDGNISSENKRLITLEKSNHVITYDYDYKYVFEETKIFFAK